MAFPVTARYFIKFRHSDTGLLPQFTYFKSSADVMPDITPQPTIFEVAGGTYYFDYEFADQTSDGVIFEVDGGASIPTEEVRYVSDSISPKDYFLDEPISQVHEDVWSDETDYTGWGEGITKGEEVDFIGLPTDSEYGDSVFGKIAYARADIKGAFMEGSPAPIVGGNSILDVMNLIGQPSDAYYNDTLFGQIDYQSRVNIMGGEIGDGLRPGKSIQEIWDRIGAPVDTVSADLAAVASIVNDIINSVGYSTDDPGSLSIFGQVYALANGVGSIPADLQNMVTSIKGVGGPDLMQLAGVGFVSTNDSLVALKAVVQDLTPADNVGIAQIWGRVQYLPANTSQEFINLYKLQTRLLGLLHENAVLDQLHYNAENKLDSGRIRIYDSDVNASAARAAANQSPPQEYDTGKQAELIITGDYVGANLKVYTAVRSWLLP